MRPGRAVTLAALTAGLLLAGCAGSPTKRTSPPRDVGHGSVEEVVAAMALERLPCGNPQNVDPTGYEQAVSCRLGTNEVTIVHFYDAGQAKAFEDSVRAAGGHGVFAQNWGMRVPTAGLAKRIGTALVTTGYV